MQEVRQESGVQDSAGANSTQRMGRASAVRQCMIWGIRVYLRDPAQPAPKTPSRSPANLGTEPALTWDCRKRGAQPCKNTGFGAMRETHFFEDITEQDASVSMSVTWELRLEASC